MVRKAKTEMQLHFCSATGGVEEEEKMTYRTNWKGKVQKRTSVGRSFLMGDKV